MKTPQPFCCDITSGTTEEQQEFKRLFRKASKQNWNLFHLYYGYNLNHSFDWWNNRQNALIHFTRIIPLSEGIAILKQMVGEEERKDTLAIERVVLFLLDNGKYVDAYNNEITPDLLLKYDHEIDGGEGILFLDRLQPKS